MTTAIRPEDCSTILCPQGIEIRRSGDLYAIWWDGWFQSVHKTAMEAMARVDAMLANPDA